MSEVVDSIGRTFDFNKIRFKLDEALLQQASLEIQDQTKGRAQQLFERYCHLHLQKYRRNYEPAHFSNGRIKSQFQKLYENLNPVIRVTIDIRSGDLYQQYVGMPITEIEAAIVSNPRAWIEAGHVVATES